MRPLAYITTSWDDGHPSDLRLANLLHKYNLPATFYIPFRNVLPVLAPRQVAELSSKFEVGAHTLHHCDLLTTPDHIADAEIADCKDRLEEICGRQCTAFCFPKGRFRQKHIRKVRDSGFRVARTVELMSLEMPRMQHGVAMIPTTVQAVPTDFSRVACNSLKRLRPLNLFLHLRFGKSDWGATAEAVLQHVLARGGVFHLWGHSWEIDQRGQWQNLERVFAMLSSCSEHAVFIDNTGLADAGIN